MRALLKMDEIAEELGVTRRHVYRLISRKVIPSVRINGALRVPRGAWNAWLARQDRAALRNVKRSRRSA